METGGVIRANEKTRSAAMASRNTNNAFRPEILNLQLLTSLTIQSSLKFKFNKFAGTPQIRIRHSLLIGFKPRSTRILTVGITLAR